MKKPFEPIHLQAMELDDAGYCTTSEPPVCSYGALPGEKLVVMPFTRRKRKIFAHPLEVLEASENRVTPPCSAAGVCGGCSLQHMATDQQIVFKQGQVEKVFASESVSPAQWYKPLTGPLLGYRGKARLGVKFVEKKGKVMVGFREKQRPFIAELSKCHVLKGVVGDLLEPLAELVASTSVSTEIPQIEVAVGDRETALVFRHLTPLASLDIDQLCAFGAEHDLSIYLQPGNLESVSKLYPDDGCERLHYSLPDFDLTFAFHPMDFTQVNAEINRVMVSRAVALLDVQNSDRVLDAFCGIGNFSLALARKAASVVGIEGSETSVVRARENADTNGITNAVFIAEDLFSENLDIPALQDVNKVMLDPPRSGALALCKKLASNKVDKVVYVSCNPVTLARDAKILVANGFLMDGSGVIDMFPHTTHVESIACFSSQNLN